MESFNWHLIENFWKSILTIVSAGGGGAVIAWLLFKKFSDQWLETKFSERLELQKHEHSKELEQLRSKINAVMDRKIKLQQQEFEVLQDLWDKLNIAYRSSLSCLMNFVTFPDFDGMSSADLEDWLASSTISDWRKKDIKNSSEKNKLYSRQLQHENIHRALSDFQNFHFVL